MKNIIHIYGAAGSGTSTLGKKISDELGYRFMDTDDYFWLPTDPKYTAKRDREERVALIRRDIGQADNVVLSGSLVDWGDEIIPLFSLVIRLVTETEVRVQRLREREKKEFGSRIASGGDMYQIHEDFIEWARAYDSGDLAMRSKAKHDAWQELLRCKQLVLNGEDSLEENYKKVKKALDTVIGRVVTVTIDRPLGSYHPKHKEMYYPINYGYINGTLAPDGEEQDAYVLGVNIPVAEFTGKIIAVVYREDDVEEKWVVCPEDMVFSVEEIQQQIHFQERYFDSHLQMEDNI